MVFQNDILAGSSGASGASSVYQIDQSIRFNNDDNAYMSRTQDTADSKRRLTFSWWMKRGSSLGTEMVVISAGASSRFMVRFNTSDKLTFRLTNGTTEKTMTTDMVFRDVSAWYHCVWIADCTTGSDFSRLYVNGSLVTMTGTQPSSNTDFAGYGDGSTMAISSLAHSLSVQEFDGYLAEMVLIDDDALLPTSFGEETSDGIWKPIDVSGLSFGTNGFHLKGELASDLGNDSSSNNNDFTTSGLDTHDLVLDSPTNNWCVGNPEARGTATNASILNGNLEADSNGSGSNLPATFSLDSGKWYWEVNNHNNGTGNTFGVGETPTGSFHHFALGSNGNQINTNSVRVGSLSSGTIIGFKLDFDAGTLEHTTDGTTYTSTGSLTANMAYSPYARISSSGSARIVFNFGQDSTFGGLETGASNSDDNGLGNFQYSVPSGFLSINTKNLGAD